VKFTPEGARVGLTATAAEGVITIGFSDTRIGIAPEDQTAAGGPLIGRFEGTEAKPIAIERSGMRRSVSIPGVLDITVEGIAGANQNEPISLDNVAHPAASQLALAKASGSHMHAFGINWDDISGKNNGHFAPFNWSSS
jgi:hypothetical protein